MENEKSQNTSFFLPKSYPCSPKDCPWQTDQSFPKEILAYDLALRKKKIKPQAIGSFSESQKVVFQETSSMYVIPIYRQGIQRMKGAKSKMYFPYVWLEVNN